ncbi:MAG: hypothetical protein GX591_13105 [Planctomycetes bacterium]|nr:hypothetical protein [Planctomycetota bacterium]
MASDSTALRIGWGRADITPPGPCFVAGQFHVRISERVLDPVTATALALSTPEDAAVLVSCDLVSIPDDLRDAVRRLLADVEGLDPRKVLISATHAHTGPELRVRASGSSATAEAFGVELEALDARTLLPLVAERVATAVRQAWAGREPGRIACGQGAAVVGRNRRWVARSGRATMYGNTNTPDFSHIEGYEDHSLGLVATYDAAGALTGLVVNVPCPSQVSEHEFAISADYWCETRQALRDRYGADLHVLAQCSAAGDQSPHLLFDKAADRRMRELSGRTVRQEIAHRIAAAVDEVLPLIAPTASGSLPLAHRVETLALPVNALTAEDVAASLAEAAKLRIRYEQEIQRLAADPSLRGQPRWYAAASGHFRQMRWYEAVAGRYEAQKTSPTMAAEVHVIRLGDLAVATNPFEFYLDFGIAIKARSPAVHTMLVQLAGGGTYCPSPRSVAGAGYGSLPASNPVGPAGGRMLSDRTIEVLAELWPATSA